MISGNGTEKLFTIRFEILGLVSFTSNVLFPLRLLVVKATPTIPDKRVGTRSKFSLPPTFNVDNQVIFALLVGKSGIFFNID